MKKRIISLVMAMFIIVLAVTLTACGSRNPESNTTEYTLSDISSFKNIEGKDTLFYDKDTRVVYYLFSTKNDNIKVTKKGNIKITNIGYFFDGEKIL